MSRYAKRLDRDLVRWREAGWVSADGETAIRRDIAGHSSKLDLASVLGILGAVLIGFGAMSFVAAHWSEMPRLFRLVDDLRRHCSPPTASPALLFERNHPTFAHAADPRRRGAVRRRHHADCADVPHRRACAGCRADLGAGRAAPPASSCNPIPALALAMLLIGLWSGWEMTDSGQVHWAFLLGWGAVTAAIAWQRWVPGLHLAAVAMAIWIVSLGYLLFDGHGHGIVVGIGLLIAAAGVAAPIFDERLEAGRRRPSPTA